jgi:hypothetical protein
VTPNPLDDPLAPLLDHQRAVWVVAVLAYGVGDLATTTVGLSLGRVAEAGPLATRVLARWGWPGLVGLKTVVLAAFFALWYAVRTPGRVAVPLALAVVGVGVTLWNLVVIW